MRRQKYDIKFTFNFKYCNMKTELCANTDIQAKKKSKKLFYEKSLKLINDKLLNGLFAFNIIFGFMRLHPIIGIEFTKKKKTVLYQYLLI
jgi:uncharacterized Fe-S radical SAM superfamily protein PflX